MSVIAMDFQQLGDAALGYQVPAAIYRRAPVQQRPWPVAQPGTGGLAQSELLNQGLGYQRFEVRKAEPASPYLKLMEQARQGFGRTMFRLPEVFGVSRQTLYNWLKGDMPTESQHARITHLAAAAQVFLERGFRPTSTMLDRTLSSGKTFLQLLSEGADGRETAEKLVRVVQRSARARTELKNLLANDPKPKLDASAFGAQARNEKL